MRILGFVPARGGSKGVPGKNSRPLAGKPLLARAVETARAAGVLDRVLVSTDDPALARAARDAGAEAPWLRPAELAQDGSPMVDAVAHALGRLDADEGYRPDAVMILQATSPFRTAETIRRAARLFAESGGASVISVTEARPHPYWTYRLKDGRLKPFMDGFVAPPPRQQHPPAYALDGSVFLFSRERFLASRSIYSTDDVPLIVPPEEALDIDTPLDWEIAEALCKARQEAVR